MPANEKDAGPRRPAPGARPDAILYPDGQFRGPLRDRLVQVKNTFGPVFGTARVKTSKVIGLGVNLATPDDGTFGQRGRSRLLDATHPRAGEDRYDWYIAAPDRNAPGGLAPGEALDSSEDRPEMLRFGYLREFPEDEPLVPGLHPDLAASTLGKPASAEATPKAKDAKTAG